MQELNLEEILARTKDLKEKKVGYVAIIGRPNVGKSTFINSLIGEKVSIISNIPQTTRKRVLAIFNDFDSQIIFFDTPGIHKNEKEFNQKINHEAIKSMREADLVLYFVDSSRPYGDEEKQIEEILEFINIPILKIFTKIDLPKKIEIPNGEDIIKISSIQKSGFEELLQKIKTYLKISHPYYPEDYYTDQDIYFRISEIIREKVFLHTIEEIPHSIYVEIEEILDEENLLKIQAYIYTETDSQRYIIIGKNGDLITKIGMQARIELESIFGKKVFLSLRVKTMEKWRKNDKIIKNILK
ncbi:MAG: GTPase Era [Candidatus Gracilibacteria bacterium]|nr:GTPase Era [Candidatus Gracilibacteria bacterium]